MITAVIAAAGRGSRMKMAENKVFLPLRGKSVLTYSIEAFARQPEIEELIVIAAPHEVETMTNLIEEMQPAVRWQVVAGGSERQYSVENALAAVDDRSEMVLVHDGARPLITEEVIERVIAETRRSKASIAAVPVKDTIKRVDVDGTVVATPKRSELWAVQTPQGFETAMLKEAYRKARDDAFLGTDDASLVERLGQAVTVAEGDYQNIKITTPEDLIVVAAFLEGRTTCE